MAKEQHVHKLRRHTYKTGNAVYFCALPDCTYKISTALALGKRAMCWICGEPFIMNEYSIRLAKPHCEKCHKPKSKVLTIEDVHVATSEAKIVNPMVSNPANDLRSRLTGVIQAATPDDEDI